MKPECGLGILDVTSHFLKICACPRLTFQGDVPLTLFSYD